jgi:serine/threonine protein phosphatase PrpC
MLHGIEALFGRNRDHHRKRRLFSLRRREHNNNNSSQSNHNKEETDELAKLFSDKAHTEKELLHGPNFGFGAMQGWRATMEDKHKHLMSFDDRSWKLWSYFALFDGHNGKKYFKEYFIYLFMIIKGVDTARNAADHLDTHLLDALNQMLDTQDNETIKHGEPVRSSQLDLPKLRAAIVKTYYELDRDLRTLIKDESGCVCVSFILFKKRI